MAFLFLLVQGLFLAQFGGSAQAAEVQSSDRPAEPQALVKILAPTTAPTTQPAAGGAAAATTLNIQVQSVPATQPADEAPKALGEIDLIKALRGEKELTASQLLQVGYWVDFVKDLLQFWHPADVDVALERNGARTFRQRLPWRLLHIGLSAATAIALVEGWRSAFAHPTGSTPLMVPIVGLRF